MYEYNTSTDARLSVVESDTKRHESDIKDLKLKQTTMEICMSCLPSMEKKIDVIGNKLETLESCSLKSAAEASAKKQDFWDTKWGERTWDIIRAAALVLITLLYAMNQHLIIGAGK